MILIPAYGRDYYTVREVLKDWNENKDFRIQDISSKHAGRYINKTDAENQKLFGITFKFRFNKLTEFVFVEYKDGKWRNKHATEEREE